MMASIDIPWNDDEVGAAAASEEDVGMTTTQPLAGSSYSLGDRQDCVLTIDAGNVKITSISVPEKHVTLTTKRWACFMWIREEVNIEAREVNRQMRSVAYLHTLANYTTCLWPLGMDLLTFVVFTFHTGLQRRTCILLAMELVFALTNKHIY